MNILALVKTGQVLLICFSLNACVHDITSERVPTSALIKNVSLAYQPATGEGGVLIALHHNVAITSARLVDLGESDSFVITSGKSVSTIRSMPKLEILVPVTIDATKEFSVEFMRSGEVVESLVVELNQDLKPVINLDEYKLNSAVSKIPVSVGYGLTSSDSIGDNQSFGYNTETIQCHSSNSRFPKKYAEQKLHAIELKRDDYTKDIRFSKKYVPIGMSEIIYDSNLYELDDAAKLASNEYERCETIIYSFIRYEISPNHVIKNVGDDLSLGVTLLSAPEIVSVHRSFFNL